MKQNWKKHSLVFRPDGRRPWMLSHAQVPTPYATGEGRLRIYFGTRDAKNRTLTTFLEVKPESPEEVLYLHDRPVLPLGKLGCFDDAGVMPSCVLSMGQEVHLYYAGWNTSTTVPYRIAIGLAISRDDGVTFERAYEGPILERTPSEPYFCGTPFVMQDAGTWRMWYLSCTGWRDLNGCPEPNYLIRYAESVNGVDWQRPGTIAVNYRHPDEALARPWVMKDADRYRMWFSARSIHGYRYDRERSYRISYAESVDGVAWERMDDITSIDVNRVDWDSEMQAYPSIFDLDCRRLMFYNGNGFGASGFGFAEMGKTAS